MKIFKKMKKGFTLVELVVVIAVIAILSAVSVGAYFGITDSANSSRLEQEAKQVHTAIQAVALAPNDHSSLSKTGLTITDAGDFEAALEENLGIDVALTDVQDTKDSKKPTIYFVDPSVTPLLGGPTVYSSFEYFSHEIGGKRAVADVVTGEVDVVNKEDSSEELPENLPTVKTIEEALTAPVDSPVEISGIVTVAETYNEQYSNITFTITDGTNSIEIYRGTYDSQLVRGDIVDVKGTITSFGGVNQIKQGAIVTKTGHDTSYDEIVYVTSISEALTSDDDTYVKLTGTVISIETPYSEQYGNISLTISDEQGNKISAYRTKGNAELLDIVEITGVMDTHNSKRQIGEDSNLVNTNTKHTCTNYHDADCFNPKRCVVCNTAEDGSVALDHIDETGEGECDRCGYNVNTQTITFSIEQYATANGWSDDVQYETATINDFLTATISGTSNSGKYFVSNHSWRLYESENSTLTVSALHNAVINSIKIDYEAKNNGKFVECNSGETIEVNDSNAIFTVEILDDEKNSNVQITSIEISFIPGELPPHTDHTFDNNGECTYEGCDAVCSHTWENKTGFCDVCSFACNHTLNAGETCDKCGYTKPGKLTGVQNVTVVIENYADEHNWADSTKYPKVEIDDNVVVSVTGSSNTGKYYENGENWRIYQNETPTVTISSENGYSIISVKTTYSSSSGGTFVLNGKNIPSETLIDVYAETITFDVGNTGEAANGQVRITKIEVSYIATEDLGTPPSHEHEWNNDGTCSYPTCTDVCQHTSWNSSDGTCSTCGYQCTHTFNSENICTTCGFDNSSQSDTPTTNNKEIVFKSSDSSNDSGTALTKANFITNGISSNDIDGLGCTDVSKVYNGKSGYGLKLGASGSIGSFTLSMNLANVKEIIISTAKYSSDTGKVDVSVNGASVKKIAPNASIQETSITLDNLTITSLKIATTSKRAYVTKITFVF